MDFFGILFDMKNGKKVPYSKTYFDTLFAAKLGGSDVKTLTGTLPLTFRTSETALRSWTIYGADIEHVETSSGKSITFYTDEDKLRDWTIYGNAEGVGERTSNMFNKDDPYTVGKYLNAAGSEVSGATWGISDYIPIEGNTTYTAYNLSGGGASACWYDENKAYINGVAYSGATSKSFSLPSNAKYIRLTLRLINPSNLDTLMLIEGTTQPVKYIPFGYQVPITVSQTGQTDKNYDIFIGDSPLTEGETVSKSSTGVDIATADGNNTITTSLYNQPDMSITYNEFTGVGIHGANVFMIALKLKAGGSTENVFNMLMNKPLRAGETLTSEQTGKTIKTVAGVENKLSPSPKAESYGGNFEMTIKYKE